MLAKNVIYLDNVRTMKLSKATSTNTTKSTTYLTAKCLTPIIRTIGAFKMADPVIFCRECPYDINSQCEADCRFCKLHITVTKLNQVHKLLLSLEYVLDSENQKRKRQDKPIQKAWGYAIRAKGLVNDILPYYQSTYPMFEDKWKRNKVNSTWSKRTKKLFFIVQKAKHGGSK